jgi:hypothetical protein
MVAPALVAVNVPAGTDHVVFRFRGYGDYPELFALSALTVALIAVVPLCLRRRRRVPSPGDALDDRVPFGDVVHRGDLEAGPGGEG